MWIRIDDVQGLFAFGMIYVVVVAAIGRSVLISILRRRRIERAYRIRLAQWRAANELR